MLRPFFDLNTGKPNTEAVFPNSAPGACQEYNPLTHPDLDLETTMVSMPQVEPGDYVAWHCDTIHAVDKEHRGTGDSSVMYIPACAMTRSNLDFLMKQRSSALKYSPPPDFPGAGGDGELGFTDAVDWNGVDQGGKRAMGMGKLPWDIQPGMSSGAQKVIEAGNRAFFG